MCGPASGWAKLAFVVLLIGLAVHIAGWATTYWMVYSTTNGAEQINVGLWRMKSCSSGTCEDTSIASLYQTAAFNSVRAFETITFCLAMFAIILLLIYMCAEMAKRQTMAAVVMVLCYVAGICSLVGMIVFFTTLPSPFEVSWSMGMTVIAMTMILIAGTLMFPDVFEGDDYSEYGDDDDYFGTHRRRGVSPMSYRKQGPPSRGITPISLRDTNGFRSY